MNFFKVQIKRIKENDPSVHTTLEALVHPSFKAMFYYKIANFFYRYRMFFLARVISYRAKKITGIEIHPGATIDSSLFIDHGCGVVIGETAIIKKNVTMYHGVTLGARKKKKGKRHPTVCDDVLLGCNSIILGNVTINEGAKIGANAVVLKDVKKNATIVGFPKR